MGIDVSPGAPLTPGGTGLKIAFELLKAVEVVSWLMATATKKVAFIAQQTPQLP